MSLKVASCAYCKVIDKCFEFVQVGSKECSDLLRNNLLEAVKPKNFSNPVIDVEHSSLVNFDSGGYKKRCPSCPDGILFVYRDNATLRLSENDICPCCGQKFRYTDIEKMRSNYWLVHIDVFDPTDIQHTEVKK